MEKDRQSLSRAVPAAPTLQPPTPLWRVLNALPATIIGCLYTLTYYPIMRFIMAPLLLAHAERGSHTALLICVVYHALLLFCLTCWLRAMWKDPGGVSTEWLSQLRCGQVPDDLVSYCRKCKCPRPDRAHHCSTCGRCVLKLDHHCPWTGGCVGHGNYKFFLLYLLATTALTGYVTWVVYYKIATIGTWTGWGVYAQRCEQFQPWYYCGNVWVQEGALKGTMWADLWTFIVFMITVSFTVATIFLGTFHLWLTWNNYTTIEEGITPNWYDMGVRANFRQVFGSRWWLWLLPICSTEGDGSNFPLNESAPARIRKKMEQTPQQQTRKDK